MKKAPIIQAQKLTKEYRKALGEIYRVLKKGGRAIIGVPNKWDPFLRPVMVTFLYKSFPSLRRHGYLIASVVQKPG